MNICFINQYKRMCVLYLESFIFLGECYEECINAISPYVTNPLAQGISRGGAEELPFASYLCDQIFSAALRNFVLTIF